MAASLARRHALWLIPSLLTLIFYAPLLTGGWSFPDGDFTHHFFPFALFQHRALRSATLPLWNPYTYGGHPFLADVQAAVFYPISNLLLILTLPITDPAARLYLLQVEAALHLILGGLFFGLLARDLTGSRLGGVVGGVCFAYSGYLTGYPPLQLAVLRTAIWLPLAFWCVLRAWQASQGLGWWLAGAAALAAAFLAGHAQTFLLLAYGLLGWIVLLVALSLRARPIRSLWKQSAGLALLLALAAALTAAQWLPSLEYLRLSVRAQLSYAELSGGFPLQDTWQMLVPGVLTTYSPLYIGVAGIELAICALVWAVAGRGDLAETGKAIPWRAGVFFFAGLAFVALLASYGGNGFLYPLLYRFAPGWALFRGQERAAYLVTVGLAALAAYGAALTLRLPTGWRRRGALSAGAVTVAGVYAFGLLWQLPGRTAISQTEYLVTAAITLLIGMALALLVALPGWSTRRSMALVALAAANLFWANMGTNLDRGTPAEKVALSPEMVALQEAVAEGATANGLPGRVYNEYRIYDDYGMRLEIEDVWGSSPLRLARYAALFEGFPLDRMWRLLGVAHVLTWRRELFGPSQLLGEFPQSTDTTYLHRLPEPGPRAWLVGDVVAATDEEAWSRLADHQFNLDAAALVAPPEAEALLDASPGASSVQLMRLADNHMRVTLNSDGGGLLVIAENWMPGWEARDAHCDGEPCSSGSGSLQPVRANLTLIGVPVPPGEVSFDLVYAPASVRWGLWVSGAAVVAALMLAWSAAARRRSWRS